MACRDEYPNYDSKYLHERTAQLCAQLAFLEETGHQGLILESLLPWWESHKRDDAIRKQREREDADRQIAADKARKIIYKYRKYWNYQKR